MIVSFCCIHYINAGVNPNPVLGIKKTLLRDDNDQYATAAESLGYALPLRVKIYFVESLDFH